MVGMCIQAQICVAFTGILCGSCEDSSAVSVLLNRCVSCGNTLAFLLPLLGEITLCTLCIHNPELGNLEMDKRFHLMNFFVAETLIFVDLNN